MLLKFTGIGWLILFESKLTAGWSLTAYDANPDGSVIPVTRIVPIELRVYSLAVYEEPRIDQVSL